VYAAWIVELINRAEKVMPERVQLYDEADKLKAEGRLDEAAEKLQQALAIDDTYALAHSALAVILQRLGRHDEAIKHAVRVTELEPNDPFSFTALSVTYQRAFAGTNQMGYIRLAEEAMERSRMLSQRH
jgi:tetratricopeptide (TPR) repeat protein